MYSALKKFPLRQIFDIKVRDYLPHYSGIQSVKVLEFQWVLYILLLYHNWKKETSLRSFLTAPHETFLNKVVIIIVKD